MAMVRSALGRVSHRLSGSSAAQSLMRQRGPEILQAPPLPSISPAVPWVLRSGPAAQLLRTFTSPATAAAACTRCIPNLQGRKQFARGAEGIKWGEQKRFFSMGREKPAVDRILDWLDIHFGPSRQLKFVVVLSVAYFAAMVTLHNGWLRPYMMARALESIKSDK